MPRSSSERIASARRSISSSSSWVESAYGESMRDVEDLVRPRAADAGDQPLVAQQRVEPARVGGEDPAERLGVELVGLRAEVGELLLERVGPQEPDARAPLGARPR